MKDEKFINRILEENKILISDNHLYHEKYSKLYNENLKHIYEIEKLKNENARINNSLRNKLRKIFKPSKGNPILPEENVNKTLCENDFERIDKEELLNKLLKYDVVSFDIFDTLIFRNISKPTLIFKIVGFKIGIENFELYRVKAEMEARNITSKSNKEINIFDIYDVLSKYIDIDVQKVLKLELEVEKDFCVANPYFKSIFDDLKRKNKKIIIISDMYLPNSYLTSILKKCGYEGYEKLFVSCDYEVAKGSGNLQKIACEEFGNNLKYIHIGDNFMSDIEGSKSIGWDTYYYKNSSLISNYKFYNNSLVSAINESIINNYFYNGMSNKNIYFEYGFKYIGLLICGYCEWLNEFAKKNNIDKILFLARDMDIVYKIYKKYYNNVPSEYVIISRTAALELNFDSLTEEFIDFYFTPRIGTQEDIQTMLIDSDLECIIDKLDKYNLKPSDMLTNDNIYDLRRLIYENKKEISKYFESSKIAAKKYLSDLIGDSKRIAVADLGWTGQIFIQLKHFIKDNINNNIEIYGNYIGNSSNSKVNGYIESGIMNSYLFSYSKNEELLLNTATLEGNTKAMILEAIFSSEAKTLLKYELKDGNYSFVYGTSTTDSTMLLSLHDGIVEYVDTYLCATKKYHEILKIAATDAYRPFATISNDFLYNYEIFKNIKEYSDSLPRFVGTRNITTIGEIMKKRNLV